MTIVKLKVLLGHHTFLKIWYQSNDHKLVYVQNRSIIVILLSSGNELVDNRTQNPKQNNSRISSQ